ncbi:hypothetical protein LUZ60_006763 [Juncus effusus]|nr:hypothetical protein LUZ60_006763 [Juncus effusus]
MTRYSALSTDASSAPSSAGDDDLPFGQRAIKLTSNLCFSFFVLAVLVVTVVAVTYQPPDPWLTSSAALTVSLSSTLPNSTFHPDDSVLPTGEDLVPLNASLIPVNSTQQSSSSPDVKDSDFEGSVKDCDEDSAVNCSDPRVLNAVKAFNVKAFTRRSIVFLSYEKPVPGGKQGECDVAWRFRNRKEKSWRRYKDYRRFRLTHGENCTLEITWVGKFRSGTNAAKSPKNPPKSRNSNPSPSIQTNTDSEINDTIPIVGSESEFKKGKYLYYTRGGDYCKSMNQFIWSFLCGLGEAQFLNRTFVIDLNICLSGAYNPFYGKDEEGKDFRFYFDFEHLKESAKVVEESEFLRDWRKWDKTTKNKNKKNNKNNDKISVRKVPTYKMTPMQLKKDKSTIIWRQFDGPEPENYWYRVCEGSSAKYIQRPWQAIWKSKHLMNIVSQIAGKMEWDFDAVHVVRGWKAQNKILWPNLDSDTSPGNLVEKLSKVIKPRRNLYVATNEPFYNHFDKLRSHFKVHLLEDYKEMWGENSEWFNETMILNGGKKVDFDGYMRVAVDTEVLYRAKTQIETFNNLTMDCKDGVNTC